MRDWLTDIKDNRARFPTLQLPKLDENKLVDQLRRGGIELSKNFVTMIVMHHASAVLLEVPWDVAGLYSATDLLTHAALSLTYLHTCLPRRIRLLVDNCDSFRITVIE